MAPPKQDDLTPVRIRGKRRGTPAEKWHHGKRRKQELQKRHAPSEPASSATTSHTSTVRPRERKRRGTGAESRLELLPTEVMQLIFEYSANIELPLVSRALASTLSKSQHLQHLLASEILRPVLGHAAATAKADLCRATRLLNSRFVTWRFFTGWLRSHVATQRPSAANPNEAADEDVDHWIRTWASLQPSGDLLPPKKLLSPLKGFTEEIVDFLAVLAHGVRDLPRRDPAYAELAYEGLIQGIREGRARVVSLILNMDVQLSTETLRVAVAESGCNQDIVRLLLYHPGHSDQRQTSSSPSETQHADGGAMDLLDTEVWAWADKAQRQGNERGQWLVAELRNAQQRRSASET